MFRAIVSAVQLLVPELCPHGGVTCAAPGRASCHAVCGMWQSRLSCCLEECANRLVQQPGAAIGETLHMLDSRFLLYAVMPNIWRANLCAVRLPLCGNA